MKFSREMKAYFKESFGYTTEPERAADYLYNMFVDEAWKGRDYDRGDTPDWSCLLDSKAYKDLRESFLWADNRWGGDSNTYFTIKLNEVLNP